MSCSAANQETSRDKDHPACVVRHLPVRFDRPSRKYGRIDLHMPDVWPVRYLRERRQRSPRVFQTRRGGAPRKKDGGHGPTQQVHDVHAKLAAQAHVPVYPRRRAARMTETPEEFRQRVERIDIKFFEDAEKRAGPLRASAFEYEKLAVDYSNRGFQSLTYLNGGALVAIPTAMSFFRADVAKSDVLMTAGFFAFGLFCVVLAQGAAFFTMAKRAEAMDRLKQEQFHRVAALGFPHQTPANVEFKKQAGQQNSDANERLRRSDIYRLAGLVFFGASLVAFVSGCGWGARTVLAAKERTQTSIGRPAK
jgi:hypothetical protein